MRQYIIDLTNDLIRRCKLDELYAKKGEKKYEQKIVLIEDMQSFIELGVVQDMNPRTLARIMSEFENGEVNASKQNLFDLISYTGDCDQMLRSLVAACLAFVVYSRLDPAAKELGFPPYHKAA